VTGRAVPPQDLDATADEQPPEQTTLQNARRQGVALLKLNDTDFERFQTTLPLQPSPERQEAPSPATQVGPL
jgi:hypothetical protein